MKIIRCEHHGQIFFAEMRGESAYELAGDFSSGFNPSGKTFKMSEVKLLAPCAPSKVVCLGRNYADHAKEVGGEVPTEPCLFIKPSTTVIAAEEKILYPEMSQRVDYEAELAVVIKKITRNVSEENALDYIFGFTCLNDVTARDLQRKDGQWTRGKSFDTFCPLGPWIETDLDYHSLKVEARLNGKTVQSGNTADMIFKVPFIVSFISRIMTLLPGDVIATGTPEGIGPMQAGDSIEIEVEGLGVLRNSVAK